MDKQMIAKLQSAVGAGVDGVMGIGTLTKLFQKLGCPTFERAESLAIAGNKFMREAGIMDNPLRFVHFIGQVAHESAGFIYMEEIADGSAYEGRKDLGNLQAGDGKRYKGRGPLQLTGRANYRTIGRLIGIDLERNPTLCADPSIGMQVATVFWTRNNLNVLCDADDVKAVTKRVNGGQNGLADRIARTNRVKGMLGLPLTFK